MYVYKIREDFFLSNDRPRTNIGPQGDHATAYALFKEFIRGLEGEDPIVMVSQLVTIFSNTDNTRKYLAFFGEELTEEEKALLETTRQNQDARIQATLIRITEISAKFLTSTDITSIVDAIPVELKQKTKYALLEFNQSKLDEIVAELSNEYLLLRNRQKYASFPRENSISPDANEGVKVQNAVKVLRELNKKLKENTRLTASDMEATVNAMSDLFFYPKIPHEKLILLNTPQKKSKWKKIVQKKYNAGTKPRNNDLKILYFVSAMHVDTLGLCFPFVLRTDLKEGILSNFIEKIAREWAMDEKQLEDFLSAVRKFLWEDYVPQSSTEADTESGTNPQLSDHSSDEPANESFLRDLEGLELDVYPNDALSVILTPFFNATQANVASNISQPDNVSSSKRGFSPSSGSFE